MDRGRDGGCAVGGDGASTEFSTPTSTAAIRARRRAILPAGLLSRGFAWGFVVCSSAIFLLAAATLESAVLRSWRRSRWAIVFFYSFTKRFTSFSHLVLGFALGIAPAAAWIAMRGSLDPRILWLTAAVTFWTAGFDVIYSCQDYEFDLREGLFSLPRRFGIAGALWIARAFHVGMIAACWRWWTRFHLGALGAGRNRRDRAAAAVRAQPGESRTTCRASTRPSSR